MPIEIKELIVRATIITGENQMSGKKMINEAARSDDRRMIVQECVDAVMQILKDKNER